MKNIDVITKMNEVEKLLKNNHDLCCTYIFHDLCCSNQNKKCKGVSVFLTNEKIQDFCAYIYLSAKTLDKCDSRTITNDLQHKYGSELLKELKIN